MARYAEIITPTLTFFTQDGELDLKANEDHIEFLIQNGVDGLLVLGSTGEFVAMATSQKKELIDLYSRTIRGRVSLYVGTGSTVYKETVDLSNYAFTKGADAVLVVPPYYYKYDEESLYSYYCSISPKINGEILLYNYPARTGNILSLELSKRVVEECQNIVGYKDSGGDIEFTKRLIEAIQSPDHCFRVYSGYDSDFPENVSHGGAGCMAALSNIIPDLWSRWVQSYMSANQQEVDAINQTITELMELYNVKSNFIPVLKYVLILLGRQSSDFSLDIELPLTQTEKEKVASILLRGNICIV